MCIYTYFCMIILLYMYTIQHTNFECWRLGVSSWVINFEPCSFTMLTMPRPGLSCTALQVLLLSAFFQVPAEKHRKIQTVGKI